MKYASLFLTKKFIIINTKNITRRYGKASPDKLIKEKDAGFIKLSGFMYAFGLSLYSFCLLSAVL